jgi:RNA polymerase sigma factor (sigma-70 family)
MITEQEAQTLMIELIRLRNEANSSDDSEAITAFKQHENLCVQKFDYLIWTRTSKYRKFPNYEDLVQEGYVALMRAMKNYDPKKGAFFWWAHKYIDTRIARSANQHTTIRYPLQVAKKTPPHKEPSLPHLSAEESQRPDNQLETCQISSHIQEAMDALEPDQQKVVALHFGLDGDKPLSINKICRKLGIPRSRCRKILRNSLTMLGEMIDL